MNHVGMAKLPNLPAEIGARFIGPTRRHIYGYARGAA